MKKIPNIATAGDRCFCPGCVRELPTGSAECNFCAWTMARDYEPIPAIDEIVDSTDVFNDVSPKFFKFLVAYGRATHDAD